MKTYFTTVCGRRNTNQDSHIIKGFPDMKMFMIADAHGDHSTVSKFLKKNIPKYYDKPPFVKTQHIEIFNKLQKKLLEHPHSYTCGSTCLLMFLYKQNNDIIMNTVNLGDSRLIILYDDDFKQITTDHSPNEKNELKRIEKLGGKVYVDEEGTSRIGYLSVSRVFGDVENSYVSCIPDVFYNKLSNKVKYIIMTCDGVFESLKNNDILKIIKKAKLENKHLAVEIVNMALKKGSGDNISVIVIEINNFENIFK